MLDAPSSPSPALHALAALTIRVGLFHRLAGAGESDLRSVCPQPQQHSRFAACRACRGAFGAEEIAAEEIALSAGFVRNALPAPWAEAIVDLLRLDGKWGATAVAREADRLAGPARLNGGPLRSILSTLSPQGGHERPAPTAAFLSPSPLALSRAALFPTRQRSNPSQSDYRRLWQGLTEETGRLRDGYAGASLDACLSTLDGLLLKYTWSVPWQAEEGVSLYQHLRSAAAIAACLAAETDDRTAVEEIVQEGGSSAGGQPEFVLIAGDLSGIQSFLYTIAAEGAARSLRGRSLYLDILCDVLARWLLQRLALPLTNLLYSGGGRFYLLAPSRALARWPELRTEMISILLRHHQADLAVVTAAVKATRDDLGRFEQTWSRANRKLAVAKRRRFAELPAEQFYNDVFSPRAAIPARALCAICSRAEAMPHANDEKARCRTCAALEHLGHELVNANYLVLAPAGDGSAQFDLPVFHDLSFAVGLCSEPFEALRRAGPDGVVLALNDTRFLSGPLGDAVARPAQPPGLGIRFLAQTLPRDENGGPADFDALGSAARGLDRLGVLRMDVDDLGLLFGAGLHESGLAGVTGLSLALRIFFEGYLNAVAGEFNRAKAGGKDQVYSVYAGGDDLFMVGSWDIIPELAARIHADFAEYAGGNAAVHISAGIAVIETKWPLYLGAEAAGESLESGAKQHRGASESRKDAVSFLDRTMSWTELQAIRDQVQWLEELVAPVSQRAAASRGLLHLLQNLGDMQRDRMLEHPAPGAPAVHYGPWMWLAAYQLTRMKEQRREIAGELDRLQRELLEPGRLERIAFAARWAEYLIRSQE